MTSKKTTGEEKEDVDRTRKLQRVGKMQKMDS